MDDSGTLNEHEVTWAHLSVTSSILRKALEMELAQVGLTVPQSLVLSILKSSPEPLTPTKLARLMYREPHSVSALLTRMEKQGLVKRTPDLARKNWVRVSLTKKGEEAYKRQVTQRKVRNITRCLSKEELDVLNQIIRKVRAEGVELIREMQPSPYDVLL